MDSTTLDGDQTLAPLYRRIDRVLKLSERERAQLRRVATAPIRCGKRTSLVELGDTNSSPLVVLSGFLIAYRLNSLGDRLVVDVLLPGDITNLSSLILPRADVGLMTISDASIARFSGPALWRAESDYPRIGALLAFFEAGDRSIQTERLYSVTRRSGYQRLCHFFLELRSRMERVGLLHDDTMEIPVTLELLGDLLGLTLEHTSRLLMRLRNNSLIRVRNGHVEFLSVETLIAVSNFDPWYLYLDALPRPFGASLRDVPFKRSSTAR